MHIKRKRLRAYRMKKSESPLRFRSFFRFSARRFSAVFAVCDAVRGGRPSGGSGCSGFGSAADGLSPRCVKSPPQRAALPARSDKKRRAGDGAERPLCSVPRPALFVRARRQGCPLRRRLDASWRQSVSGRTEAAASAAAGRPPPTHSVADGKYGGKASGRETKERAKAQRAFALFHSIRT